MGRGRQTPDETIERIKATFAETGSYEAAAKSAGVSWATAQKYADSRDEFETIRAEKRLDIIAEINKAQAKLIAAMVDDAHLAKASVQEIAMAFGIVTDKGLLLTGQATSRTETINGDPIDRLSVDDIEQLERLRSKLVTDGAPV